MTVELNSEELDSIAEVSKEMPSEAPDRQVEGAYYGGRTEAFTTVGESEIPHHVVQGTYVETTEPKMSDAEYEASEAKKSDDQAVKEVMQEAKAATAPDAPKDKAPVPPPPLPEGWNPDRSYYDSAAQKWKKKRGRAPGSAANKPPASQEVPGGAPKATEMPTPPPEDKASRWARKRRAMADAAEELMPLAMGFSEAFNKTYKARFGLDLNQIRVKVPMTFPSGPKMVECSALEATTRPVCEIVGYLELDILSHPLLTPIVSAVITARALREAAILANARRERAAGAPEHGHAPPES